MGSPPPIWHAASQEWVEEHFPKDADKDGKMYVRKDGDWLEIPPNANPGPYLPLSGGTMTGALTLNSDLYVKTGGWVDIEGGAINIKCPSSHISIESPGNVFTGPTSFNSPTAFYGSIVVTGNAGVIRGSNIELESGGTARLASMSDIVQIQGAGGINITTPPAAWSSSITLDSAGGVKIPKNASIGTPYNSSVVIHGGLVQIGCEGSNLELSSTGHVSIGPKAYLEETYINGRFYKNGPDGMPIVDIPDTNNRAQYPLTPWQNGNQVPQIQIGSSNYKVDFGVNGRLWGNPMVGTLRSWNESENTYIYMGSGLYIHAGQYHIELRTVAGPMNFYSANNFNFNGSGFYHTGDFYIQGQAFKPSGGSWQSTSDKRLKSDIEPYEDGLNKLTKLKPIKFRYNERARQAETGRQFVGLAAEEAKEVMPSIVGSTKAKLDYEDTEPTDVLTIDPSELIYTVINALKQIDKRLQTLEEFYHITREEQ